MDFAVEGDCFNFFALGDWGHADLCAPLADAMSQWIQLNPDQKPLFILSLGDNFYPKGVVDVESKRFDDTWRVFVEREELKVPWRLVLGNHDYSGNPDAQIQFTKHSNNYEGKTECICYIGS